MEQTSELSKNVHSACSLDICLSLTSLGQARQFIETCGTYNPLYGRYFVYFWADLLFQPKQPKNQHFDCPI